MAEDIQGLLNRIQTEGVKKAEDEKAKIIADAKACAASIVKEAENKAASIVKKAEEEAAVRETKGAAAIRQAARDVLISLKTDILKRLQTVVKECAGAAMTPEIMGKVILEMVRSYAGKTGTDASFELIIPKKNAEDIEKLIRGSLFEQFKGNAKINISGDFASGLQIGFKGSDVFLDFSDDALSEVICNYVGPKLATAIKG